MAADYRTPGVYIEEKNAFPGSAVAVETAVPVFIGYTEKAERNGKSLKGIPTKVTSLAEFSEMFGAGFRQQFSVAKVLEKTSHSDTFAINNEQYTVQVHQPFMLFSSLRLFYANGGADCFILSVGDYSGSVKASDLNNADVFLALEKEFEPTMVVIPDAVVVASQIAAANPDPKKAPDYTDFYGIYQAVLAHCAKVQSRVGIFDVLTEKVDDDAIGNFRTGIGANLLNYGNAYYPWLNTAIVQNTEIDFRNLGLATDAAKPDTTKGATQEIATAIAILTDKLIEPAAKKLMADAAAVAPLTNDDATKLAKDQAQANLNFHQGLLATSPTYVSIMNEIRSQLNRLPPAAAMAGIYTFVDNSRGVWKAPANVSLSMVSSPTSNITSEQQASYNVDPMTGKSINIIRPFRGIGTMVWGARTLDGNSQDWRYINVRRTLIMIEQSIKLAMRSYVFEPNTSATWISAADANPNPSDTRARTV